MLRLTILLSILLVGRISNVQTDMEGRVIRVLEGDLIEVVSADRDTLVVRLANIDCPENGQEFFEEARKFAEKLCLRKKIRVIIVEEDEDGNVYGRLLLENDKTLNSELVEAGLAWHKRKGLQVLIDTKELNEKEELAKTEQRGVWSKENSVAPWIFRRNQNKYEAKNSN